MTGYTYVSYLKYLKKYKEALQYLFSLKQYIHEETSKLSLKDYNSQLKEVYLLLGDYRSAYECFEKETEYKEAHLNDSSMTALAEMKTEQAMMIERMDREKAEAIHIAEKQKMRIIIFSLVAGLALISLLVFYIFRVLKLRKTANAVLAEKNQLLAEQNNKLAEQKEEIESQRDEIMAQRDHIEAQSKEIQASINYARRIQRALLTPDEAIGRVFSDYFLLYKPRSVVSGDFYWVGQFGDNKVCIVADCTGHGVPGGFMSVLGMTNLNYIVSQEIAPDAILNKLREAIISNLRQSNSDENLNAQVYDGMDVAAYVVNEKQMTLSFAGANNPLILIRDNEVQIIKPDRMPVGISIMMKPFNTVTVELRKGDCLYTYSDGFQDQFGYDSDRKFQKNRLRNLLLEIHTRPMSEQRELLNLVFKEWRGPAENQTDDVVIMGVRI
ncbi:MAG: SpoIIE family protein phosphatase [Salinivirgaceae bacterium]|nr:SpoIIE family protein phosphatase [Salinivirgaceae bacterium]